MDAAVCSQCIGKRELFPQCSKSMLRTSELSACAAAAAAAAAVGVIACAAEALAVAAAAAL